MKSQKIKQLAVEIGKLSEVEIGTIKKSCKQEHKVESEIVEAEMAEAFKECHHCGGEDIIQFGQQRWVQALSLQVLWQIL